MTTETLASLIHFLGILLLISSFWILTSSQIRTSIRAYAAHSFFLALITGVIAIANHIEHLLISAILTFGLKAIVIPHVFFRMIRRLGIRKEVESYVNIPFTLLLAVLLVFVSFYVTRDGSFLKPVAFGECIPLAIATVFFGMLMMTTRKKAISQILGLLLIENGLFLMAVTMTFGMPLLVEMGIFFDLLVAVMIMGVFIFKIRDAFESIDTDEMTGLKG
ncbi:MAG: Hydrogenase-4 component E [Candidatus Omnitrophica bacterium ADurb.Bin292]|jgi:hydrogenase-4 component E|nr:MAG: Hydrogenase-4 component E [Candidatus Omnitrophica bacterium ADurb.Bin292]HOG23347.1 formate hydrogenlyase [Candidatus Omnitrophota bacterium]HPW77048.1 formate hydrogenlyase [Candidatus Omnitrophota bacterium]HQB11602.1 formate hydrogenlyase [Candidatus Omnitrophota bacterium]